MINKFSYYLATGFGSGFLPAPGTAGSIFATFIWIVILQYLPWWTQVGVIILSLFFGYIIVQQASVQLAEHDPKQIVWDEFIGMWIALLFVQPLFESQMTIYAVIISFLLFRFFDILKPFPISWIDSQINNSWGVILDDVVAGLFAGISLYFLSYLFQ